MKWVFYAFIPDIHWHSHLHPYESVTDSDYENANRTADVDVELMAFQSIIGDDYKGQQLFLM